MFKANDGYDNIWLEMLDEAPVAGNPVQQMAPTNTQQVPGNAPNTQVAPNPAAGNNQQQQQVQVDINAAATSVVSAVMAKAKDLQTAQQIMGAATAILQKKFPQ